MASRFKWTLEIAESTDQDGGADRQYLSCESRLIQRVASTIDEPSDLDVEDSKQGSLPC